MPRPLKVKIKIKLTFTGISLPKNYYCINVVLFIDSKISFFKEILQVLHQYYTKEQYRFIHEDLTFLCWKIVFFHCRKN